MRGFSMVLCAAVVVTMVASEAMGQYEVPPLKIENRQNIKNIHASSPILVPIKITEFRPVWVQVGPRTAKLRYIPVIKKAETKDEKKDTIKVGRRRYWTPARNSFGGRRGLYIEE